jgi:dipeptidase E
MLEEETPGVWEEWGLDQLLRKAYEKGIILAGISAGANCWFEQCITDSMPGALQIITCLGLIQGSFCPHYDGEKERRPAFHRFLSEGRIKPGYAADDGAAIHFINEKPFRMISSRQTTKVYKISKPYNEIIEEAQGIHIIKNEK